MFEEPPGAQESPVHSELQRLESLGWRAAPAGPDGVRWLRRDGARVSYPRGVLDTHSLGEGGTGFWLDARADAVGQLLRDASISTLWDVGAGAGAMAKRLARYGTAVVSVEPLPEGASEIAAMGAEVFCGTLEDLELPPGSLTAVGLFDVLEHLEDPSKLLAEVARVLAPVGRLFVTVPAYQWLWSAEDQILGHFRRYSAKTLSAELSKADFAALSVQYTFASLVPAAAVLRTLPYRLGRNRDPDKVLSRNSARVQPGDTANRWARRILAAEAKVARRMPLPFGLSLVAVAQRRPVSA
jgi:2-polyprenyl-3-methyl-5-hydroxy-6-metoxy-1,4-benzoquinol methylase